MATATYISGAWLGVVRSNTAVLLGPGSPPALVQSLWELLADAPEVHEVLHAVTSSFGVSLAQIPSFGIVDFRDSLRVFLRGDLDLTVQLPGSQLELNGRDVTTWTERRLDAPQWYRLTVAGDPQTGPALPLSEGVILLASLSVTLTGAPAAGVMSPLATPAGAEAPAVRDAVVLVPEPEPIAAAAPELEPDPDLASAPEPKPEPGTESVIEAESEADSEGEPGLELAPGDKPDAEAELEPELEPQPQPERVADREVSAETVMGVLDDDESYGAEATETPEPAGTVGPAAHADQVPAHELTGTYDHLWEKTVVRSIEDAAVRDEPEEAEPAAGPAASADAGGGAAASSGPEPYTSEPYTSEPAAAAPAPAPPAPELAGPPPLPPTRQPAPTSSGGLIDSVPWRTGGSSAPAAQVPPSFGLPPATSGSAPASVPVSTSGPVPAVPAASAASEAGPDGFDGDHDGHTIMKSDLAGMSAHPAPAPVPDPEAAAGPLVLARVCGRGHANPPTHAQCAACGSPLPADAVQVARPRLGRMRVSTGELVDLDQSLVIGRQPSVSRVQGGVMPRLVQVGSPSGDISRSHVEVRLEGWHVMLCDLKATNGTVLVREGQPPRRLAQNEMAILLDGDIAELGDDISLRFEEIL